MSLLFGLSELFFKIRILVFRLKSSWDSQVNRLIRDGWLLCLSFWGGSWGMLLPGKIRNLRFSNCWKCTEIINSTITNVIFVSFKIFHDPTTRTYLTPRGRRAHPAHPPPPPRAYGPGQPLNRSKLTRL